MTSQVLERPAGTVEGAPAPAASGESLAVSTRGLTKRYGVSVNIFFTIFTNVFSPIAPTRMRRIRQRGCAAFGV